MSEGADARDLDQLLVGTRYQLLFFLRTWRFAGLALFTLAISMVGVATDLYYGTAAVRASQPAVSTFFSGALGSMGLEIALVAAFFGGDAVSTDFGSGTGYYALVLPVRRAVLLLGRFLAAFLVAVAVTMIYFVIEVVRSAYVYGTVPATGLVALGLILLLIAAYLAFAFFLSSLFRRPAVSTITTVLLLWLAFPAVDSVLTLVNIEPFFLIDYAAGAIQQAIAVGPHQSLQIISAANETITVHLFAPYVWEGAVIMVAYLFAFLTLSILIYDRKELKG